MVETLAREELAAMATRKQKLRAAAAGTSLDKPAEAVQKTTAKAKKTSRGK
jgi:hypothetical protein